MRAHRLPAAVLAFLAAASLAAAPAAAQSLVTIPQVGLGGYSTGDYNCGTFLTASAGAEVRTPGRTFAGLVGDVVHTAGNPACTSMMRVVMDEHGTAWYEYSGAFMFYSPRMGLLGGTTVDLGGVPVEISGRAGLLNTAEFDLSGVRAWRAWFGGAVALPLGRGIGLQVDQGWHRVPIAHHAAMGPGPLALSWIPPRPQTSARWEPKAQVSLRLRP
jgi:hypothetical protein